MALAVTDLPQPLSPTMQSVFPFRISNETPFTALFAAPIRIEEGLEIADCEGEIPTSASALLRRVGAVAQTVADEVDTEYEQRDDQADRQPHPPIVLQHAQILGDVQDVAPGRDIERHAKSEKAETGFRQG